MNQAVRKCSLLSIYSRKERRLTALEYKHKKKEYHDSTAHGLELMFDRMNEVLDRYVEDNDMLL